MNDNNGEDMDFQISFGEQSLTDRVKGCPVTMKRGPLGDPEVSLKIPGFDREVTTFSIGGLHAMALLLGMDPESGDAPEDVAQRTARFEGENLLFQFSDAPRARTLTLGPKDREELSALFAAIAAKVEQAIKGDEPETTEPEQEQEVESEEPE